MKLIEQEPYWTFRAPPTPDRCPPDCNMTTKEWEQLSPSFRREIWRNFNKKIKNN